MIRTFLNIQSCHEEILYGDIQYNKHSKVPLFLVEPKIEKALLK